MPATTPLHIAPNQCPRIQVDHLFLLVGENPLPNYVATAKLLSPNGSVHLVHTPKTKLQAKRIKKVLQDSVNSPNPTNSVHFVELQTPETYPTDISDKIRTATGSLVGKLGLHYTSGTKVMAIYAYKAISNLNREAQFSYLDANSLKLCIEMGNRLISVPAEMPVSFDTLFKLYGIDLARVDQEDDNRTAVNRTAKLPELSGEIAQQVISSQHNLPNGDTFEKAFKKLATDTRLAALRDRGWLNNKDQPIAEKLLQAADFASKTAAKEWAEGGHWLEDYVFSQVAILESRMVAIHDSGIDFPVRVGEGFTKGHKDTFQIDVAFMRHYQLFAVSCTISAKKNDCKHKLLEAYVRAKQLGGSEARVCLVCGSLHPDKIKKEIEVATQDNKVEVFGISDWHCLPDKLADWINRLEKTTT